jgi:hypothetical protein
MVLIQVADTQSWLEGLRACGVLVGVMGPGTLRAVTHLDVDAARIDQAVEAFRAVSARIC